MIIKNCKHLTKASNNNTAITAAANNTNCHDQLHLLCKLNMKYRHKSNQHQHHHRLRYHHHRIYSSYYYYLSSIVVLCVISLVLLPLCCVDAVGYSYTRFIGPVAGPEHRIYVDDAGNAQSGSDAASRLDYVAKPEYQFAYGVEDAEAHILHNRNEMRDGDAVKGVYSVVDPDGSLRVVKYTADTANGFQAEVIKNGISSLHGHKHDGTPSKETYNNFNYNSQDNQQNNYQPQLKEGVNPPNLEQYIKHFSAQDQYQTPPPIIYHYNNNENYDNNDDDDDVSGSDYNDGYQPQYEVHEKQNNDNGGNDDDNGHDNDGGGGNNYNKNKVNHQDEDDSNEYDDSEELEDYDEAVHSSEVSEESNEYY